MSGSSKLTKITDGAVHFDGTNDKLSITAHSDLDLSSGDFTVEGFVYPLRSQEQAFVNNWNNGGQFQVQMSSSGTLQASWAPYSLSDYAVTGTTPVRVNVWSHFAYTRNGNTFELFLDGISQGTQTSSANASSNSNIVLGENGTNADRDFQGFLSNVRIIKGTALYTSNFTPPTELLTNVTNTKLLCCQSNTSAVDTAVVPGTAPNTRNWSARSNWNSGGTLTNASSYPLTAAFDGNLSTTFAMSYAGGMIWTAPSTISFSSSIEVYVNSSIGTGGQGFIATISGVQQSKVDLNAAGSWETVYSGSGTFDKLEMTRNDGGNNNNLWISAIRVDGTVLVDAIAGHGNAAATTFNPFNTDINTVRGQETGYATLNPLISTIQIVLK